jgi:flagellar hook-associated protein 2
MSYGGIQIGGLASGLDTNAIIGALLSMESRPIMLLQAQKSTEESKLSLFGTLEGLVTSLQDKLADFTSSSGSLFSHSVAAANEGVAAFTVTGQPISGGHSLEVSSLAASDRWAFDGVADADADLGAGTVAFDYNGTSYSVAIDAETSTLNEIAAAINDEAGDDVTASVINVGTEGSPSYQMVIAGDDTGTDYQIENLTSSVAGVVNGTQLTNASNAQITIDGLDVERSTNVFSDVIEGLSFTVQAVDSTTFTTDIDNEGSKEKIQEFVDAYNEVIGFINTQNTYDEDEGPGGDLFGESLLQTVRSSISNALFDVDLADVQSDTEGYSTMGLLGIEMQSDGTLSIDDDVLEEKMTGNPELFTAFFTDADSGVMVALDSAIENLVEGGTDGNGAHYDAMFDVKTESINKIISGLDDSIERKEYQLEKTEEALIAKYANLEALMSGLNAQSSYLASAFTQPS